MLKTKEDIRQKVLITSAEQAVSENEEEEEEEEAVKEVFNKYTPPKKSKKWYSGSCTPVAQATVTLHVLKNGGIADTTLMRRESEECRTYSPFAVVQQMPVGVPCTRLERFLAGIYRALPKRKLDPSIIRWELPIMLAHLFLSIAIPWCQSTGLWRHVAVADEKTWHSRLKGRQLTIEANLWTNTMVSIFNLYGLNHPKGNVKDEWTFCFPVLVESFPRTCAEAMCFCRSTGWCIPAVVRGTGRLWIEPRTIQNRYGNIIIAHISALPEIARKVEPSRLALLGRAGEVDPCDHLCHERAHVFADLGRILLFAEMAECRTKKCHESTKAIEMHCSNKATYLFT